MAYRNAYTILEKIGRKNRITEEQFNRLQVEIRNDYLADKDYHNRLAIHRRPIEFKNEIIHELLHYFQEIQQRPEMRDHDELKESSGYVPSKVSEIWKTDRRLKSLYNAVKAYSELRGKNFNTMAVHIAEYRTLTRLYRQINRTTNRRVPEAKTDIPPKHPDITERSRHMHITNPAKFISEMHKMRCGEAHVAQLTRDDFEIRPYPTHPTEGYAARDNFPNCCNYHTSIYEGAKSAFERFPNCCEGHRNLLKEPWFDKRNYAGMPERLLNALSYSEYHFANKIDAEDWYEDITDYFDYTLSSFGQFPTGHGGPLGIGMYSDNLAGYIEQQEQVPEEKRKRLIAFLKDYGKPGPEVHTDLNLLISTYKKWMSIFPFQLPHLSHLKNHFEKTLPLLSSKPILNRYTGLSASKILTPEQLFEWLLKVTTTILTELNAMKLYEQGKITEVKKTRLEYLNAERRLELDELSVVRLADRPQYIKVLKRWIAGEKKYLRELTDILEKDENVMDADKADVTKSAVSDEINLFCPRMPVSVARNHFIVLVDNNSSNGKPFLSAEAFELFMRKAIFKDKTIAKQKLNVGTREKYFVIKRFFEFYQLAVRNVYEEHSQCKLKYVQFLCDNFDNWRQSEIESNFANKTARAWD